MLDLLGRERIHSVVDFGCGTGQWLAVFRDEGCEVTGFDSDRVESELLAIPNECFHAQDLTQAVRLDKRRDLAVSIEVAEHLDEQYADTFIDTITQASDIVLFSAAIPHQEGTHHVNCQWQSYWIAKFAERGYAVIDCIRPRVWSNDAVNLIYGQNMFVFCKDDKAKYGDILRLAGEVPDIMRNLVHPRLWEMYMPRYEAKQCVAVKVHHSAMWKVKWLVKKGVKFLCPYWVVRCVQAARKAMRGQK